MRRGEIWWIDPDPVRGSEQAGRRPAVVVSRDAINRASPVVVIVPLTTHRKQRIYPSDVLLRAPEGGVTADSVVLTLQVRAVAKERLRGRLGALSMPTMRRVEDALLLVLDIER